MTNLTFEELKEKLAMLDEVTILEILNINSYDLVQRFEDMIEDNRDKLEREIE
jgi:hypothetical protein